MKLTDLRLGNLIYNREGNHVYVNPNHLIIMAYGLDDIFSPIPVTEKWMIDFGFSKMDDFDVYTNVWELEGFIVSLGDYANIHVDWASDENGYHSLVCYEELHVHTLQNIFFTLKNKELVLI